jgi:hypothetical protein
MRQVRIAPAWWVAVVKGQAVNQFHTYRSSIATPCFPKSVLNSFSFRFSNCSLNFDLWLRLAGTIFCPFRAGRFWLSLSRG